MSIIKVSNEVNNIGEAPSIFVGYPYPYNTPFPANGSIWFNTNDATLNVADGGGNWTQYGGSGGALTLQNVLNNGNTTDNKAIFSHTGYTTTILEGGLSALFNTYETIVNAGLIKIKEVGNAITQIMPGYIDFTYDPSGKKIVIAQTYALSQDYFQYLLKANGFLLAGETGRATLVNGIVVVNVSGATKLTFDSTFQFSINTPLGTLGVAYQGVYTSPSSFRIFALKSNGTTETSDLSILDWTVISI